MPARSHLIVAISVLFCHLGYAAAFAPSHGRLGPTSRSRPLDRGCSVPRAPRQQRLRMAPRFDPETQRWSPSSPDEESSAGYPPVGSLLRQGPKPFFQRVFQPDLYDQAVLKFMASDGVSRDEAQGNMDAFLENPNDWAFQRFEEKNGGPTYDYVNANVNPKSLALTGVWSVLILSALGRVGYCLKEGVAFYDFL